MFLLLITVLSWSPSAEAKTFLVEVEGSKPGEQWVVYRAVE